MRGGKFVIVDLGKYIDALVVTHGSLRAVARIAGIDAGYLSRLRKGSKTAPSRDTLRRLKLRAVVVYERIQ